MILNLAAGGTFDSGYVPDSSFSSATMQVDYVRVYQKMVSATADEKPDKNPDVKTDGADDNLYGDYKLGTGSTPIVPGGNETTAPGGNDTTTVPGGDKPGTNKPSVTTKATVAKVLKRTKVKTAVKKKASKKLKITFKKVTGAKKYVIQVSKTKKFKKVLVKKTVKKVKVTISSKKFRDKKKLYVRVRAVGAKKWSKPKKVKIKK